MFKHRRGIGYLSVLLIVKIQSLYVTFIKKMLRAEFVRLYLYLIYVVRHMFNSVEHRVYYGLPFLWQFSFILRFDVTSSVINYQ